MRKKKIFLPCYICGNPKTIEYHRAGVFYCSKHASQLDYYGKILSRTKFDKNEIVILKDYAIVYIYNGENIKNGECFIDIEDIDLIKNYKWAFDKQGYVVTQINRKRTSMHRLLLNPRKEDLVDHIDLNKSNNRRNNIRICNKSQNEMNKPLRKDNTNGIRGVYKDPRCSSWDAELCVGGEKILRKTFPSREEAINARLEAEKLYFKEFRYESEKDNANKN